MRSTYTYTIKHIEQFKTKLLVWSQKFDNVVWLDSNEYQDLYSKYDAVLAVEAFSFIKSDVENAFNNLQTYQQSVNDWIFGFLTYDLKNDIEQLSSNNYDGLQFPELYFFQPKKIFLIKGNQVEMQYLNDISTSMSKDLDIINEIEIDKEKQLSNDIKIKLRIHKDEYFNKVEKVLDHIHRGDIYEANFCQEFYAEDTIINPLETYNKLNKISNAPFTTFLKLEDKYLLSASPERYLKKDGDVVISQPIKGTAKRSVVNEEDEKIKNELSQDEKERSENIMIVDLVRNDLSKTAQKGSVNLKELCKVYTYKQVHQMISTIESKLKNSVSPVELIKTTFPMGSMTGAPKISAMKIIEELEETKRGLYSGAVGYFTPKGDLDFNVVIRSILYNQSNQYVSYSVGGAITSKSNPVNEYEECLIKAKAMRTVLEN